ncbi:MAG: hypothetical protein FRX49_07343 [Trebouxia sp. A1-2]|nr:MAG: hypothetical protein FRX49_07343 [Trebouxia sp. A1-2]
MPGDKVKKGTDRGDPVQSRHGEGVVALVLPHMVRLPCYLLGVCNVALRHSQSVTHQTGNQVAVAVVANDEVWVFAMTSCMQFRLDSFGRVLSKPL